VIITLFSFYPNVHIELPQEAQNSHTLLLLFFTHTHVSICNQPQYIDAFDWKQNFKQFQMLKNSTDPKLFGPGDQGIAGNFSLVVQKVLTDKISATPSNLTLADINLALDELAAIHEQGKSSTSKTKGKRKTKKSQIADWLKQFTHGARRISPLEHKWLVRIIMGKLEYAIGFDVAAKHYHFLMGQTFSAHSSLRETCNKICYIPRVRRVSSDDEAAAADTKGYVTSSGTLSYLTGPSTKVQLGKVFAPMLSQKTGFEKILNDISKRHRAFAKAATETAANREESHRATNSLACQHPAFTIETKLDGDRMLMHYERDGSLVKFHSRRGNWFRYVQIP
jgi:DNA ligase N terminus